MHYVWFWHECEGRISFLCSPDLSVSSLCSPDLGTAQIGYCCFDVLHTFVLRNLHNKVIDAVPWPLFYLKYEGHSVGPLWDDRPEFFVGSNYLLVLRLSVGVHYSHGPGS